jgi:signal transduction histidine kinase
VPGDVAEDLVAVLREALTNVARHACARKAEVEVVTDAEQVALHVSDDGVGVPDTGRRSGLTNMHRRAERHSGQLDLEDREPGGTRLSWTVPLTAT